jgi:hypothetical protein
MTILEIGISFPTNSVLNIIGNVAEGNLEFMESLSYFSLNCTSPSSMMFAVEPQLHSFHHGHQAFFLQ